MLITCYILYIMSHGQQTDSLLVFVILFAEDKSFSKSAN